VAERREAKLYEVWMASPPDAALTKAAGSYEGLAPALRFFNHLVEEFGSPCRVVLMEVTVRSTATAIKDETRT
jgi:hypothetical protein